MTDGGKDLDEYKDTWKIIFTPNVYHTSSIIHLVDTYTRFETLQEYIFLIGRCNILSVMGLYVAMMRR